MAHSPPKCWANRVGLCREKKKASRHIEGWHSANEHFGLVFYRPPSHFFYRYPSHPIPSPPTDITQFVTLHISSTPHIDNTQCLLSPPLKRCCHINANLMKYIHFDGLKAFLLDTELDTQLAHFKMATPPSSFIISQLALSCRADWRKWMKEMFSQNKQWEKKKIEEQMAGTLASSVASQKVEDPSGVVQSSCAANGVTACIVRNW